MANLCYGLDLDKSYTATQARDALVTCFCLAHTEDAEFAEAKSDMSQLYCEELVRKAFADTAGDYDAPSKGSLFKALGYLAGFAANFRNKEIVQKHVQQITEIFNKLPN